MPFVGFLCAVTGVYPRSIWMTFFAGLAGVLVRGLVLSITLSWTLLLWGFMPAPPFSSGFAIRGLRGS
jgi:hypothetical protein